MKHFLICNPVAGPSDCTELLRQQAAAVLPQALLLDTRAPGDATRMVREYAQKYPGEECRFYACGGDGTLLEVAEGAAGVENAQVACMPYGSGNDFARLFTPVEKMRDLLAQAKGTVMELNMLQCNDRMALNIASAGLDARVAEWVRKNREKLPWGTLTYKVSLLVNFFRKLDRRFHLVIDGREVHDDLAILVAANGRYYGGGFYAVPEAEPDDDQLELLAIRKVSRIRALVSMPLYAMGRHCQLPDSVHRFLHAKEVEIRTEQPEPINVDGEILTTDSIRISISDKKLRFVVPEGVELIRNAAALLPQKKKARLGAQ